MCVILGENSKLTAHRSERNKIRKSYQDVTGYLGGIVSQKNLYRVYDLQNGELKKEIPILDTNLFKLANSILFANGYYLRLQY